jgi:hypothetical protein
MTAWKDYKRDDRPQRGCWAPGNYCCRCVTCADHFIGDKRAVQCADCAYDPTSPQEGFDFHVCAWMIHHFTNRSGPFAPRAS